MRTRFLCPLATPMVLVALARADISYVSGTQTSTATAEAHVAGDQRSQSYDIAAPDPLMSWAPPDQTITATLGMGGATVSSSYSSTLAPDQLTVHAAAHSHAVWAASTTYAQTTTISMTFGEPTTVNLSAHVVRQSLMNISIFEPMYLRFGRDGDAPIMDFSYTGQQHWDTTLPMTQFVLAPGTYTLSSFNHVHSEINGHIDDPFSSSINFSLVVPAPAASTPVLALGVGSLLRRRSAGSALRHSGARLRPR